MKVQNISYSNHIKPSFKNYDNYIDYEDDYGTYYNQISLKDAFVSAGILSAVMLALGTIFSDEQEITKLFNSLKKPLKLFTSKTFNKIV